MSGNNQQGRIFFFIVFALLALLTFFVVEPFLAAIMLALITVVLLRPLYVWLDNRRRLKGRTGLVTTLTVLLFLIVLIVPLVLISIALFNQVVDFLEEITSQEIQTSMTELAAAVEDALQQFPPLSEIEVSEEDLVQFLQNASKAALTWLTGLPMRHQLVLLIILRQRKSPT